MPEGPYPIQEWKALSAYRFPEPAELWNWQELTKPTEENKGQE